MSSARSINRGRLLALLGFALLALVIVGLHSHHFRDRPYRQDEAWIAFGSLEHPSLRDMALYLTNDNHPLLWKLAANVWVNLFGHQEAITRFLSSLTTLLGFAF